MSRKDKLIERLYRKPRDFSWDELVALLSALGYVHVKQGKTSGSRRKFKHANGTRIILHQPHPKKVLKAWQIDNLYDQLDRNGFI